VGDAVHAADAVRHQGDAHRLVVADVQLVLLAAEEGGGGRVGDGRDAGLEQVEQRRGPVGALAARGARDDPAHGRLQLALVAAARAAQEVGVREAVGLHAREQPRVVELELHRRQPGPQHGTRVLGPDVAAERAAADVALGHHALDHRDDGSRVGRRVAVAVAERAHRDRHRRVRPLGGRALVAAGGHPPGAHVGQELFRRRRRGPLGPGAADVDPRVVVGAGDAGAPVRVDVDRGRRVQLERA
jgi:hypothetical protein